MVGKTNATSGGAKANLTITAPVGVTVTISKDGQTRTKATNVIGEATFKGLQSGEWTITISDGTNTTVDTVKLSTDFTKEMSFTKVYGIFRDITASSPEWARENDAEGMTATASVGTVAGASDFDNCYPWSGIVRETLDTGDVMVKIPKFWYQRYREGNIERIKIANNATDGFALHPAFIHGGVISDCIYVGAYKTSSNNKSVTGAAVQVSQTRDTMRINARAKGTGWGMTDIATRSAIQMLFLVEFATNDSQSAIGQGNLSGAVINVGSCDSVPNLTGRPAGTDGKVDVVWRGIEGLWGNVNEFIDGVNYSGSTPYVCNDPSSYADATSTNYTKLSYTSPSSTSSVYIKQVGLDTDNPHIMLPSASGGSSSTYYCDTWINASGWMTLRTGAYYKNTEAGIFYYAGNQSTSFAGTSVGSRLQYIPQ